MRSYIMDKFALIVHFFLAILLAGCFPVNINHDYPDMYKNSADLMQLIGRDKQFVLNEFGKPDQHLTDGTNEYYIYRDPVGGETEVIFLVYMLLPYASQTEGDLKCLLFTIDDKNLIREYRIVSAGKTGNLSRNEYDTYCKNALWEETQLEKIQPFHGI